MRHYLLKTTKIIILLGMMIPVMLMISPGQVFTSMPEIDTPTPQSPGNNHVPGPVIGTLTPNLEWTDQTAEQFKIRVSKYPYGSQNVIYETFVSGTSHRVPALEKGQKYCWSVSRIYFGAGPNWSDCLFFQTGAEPTEPAPEPQPEEYTITVYANPSEGGEVKVPGDGVFKEGKEVTVTAESDEEKGFSFRDWTEDGETVSSNTSYSFPVEKDRTLIAKFEEARDVFDVAYIPVQFSDDSNFWSFWGSSPQPDREIQSLKEQAGAVNNYYYNQSYGQVEIKSHFVSDEWLRLPYTLNEFKEKAENSEWETNYIENHDISPAAANDFATEKLIIKEAMKKANLVKDRKGFTDYISSEKENHQYYTVAVIHPGTGSTHDGISFNSEGLVSISEKTGYGIWAHELGHNLFYWSDHYGSDRSQGDIEKWGLMGHGCYLNPPSPVSSYNKEAEGWLNYEYLSAGDKKPVMQLYEMQSGDSVYKYQPGTGDIDYFIIEGRHPTDGVQEDRWHVKKWGINNNKLIQDKGILLYKVKDQNIYSIGTPQYGWMDKIPGWDDERERVTLVPGCTYAYESDFSEVKFTASKVNSDITIEAKEHIPYSRKIYAVTDTTRDSSVASTNNHDPSTITYPPMENEFDIGLKAYTEDGLMVGMDYETEEYKVEIPDARTSGNIGGGGPEWISVPDDIEVYYEIDTTPAEQWMEEAGIDEISLEVTVQEIAVDEEGNRSITEETTIPIDLRRDDDINNYIIVFVIAVLIVMLMALILILVRKIIISR